MSVGIEFAVVCSTPGIDRRKHVQACVETERLVPRRVWTTQQRVDDATETEGGEEGLASV